MDRTLSPTEISVIYERDIRPIVHQAVHACLNASDNPFNRYELIQCIAIATIKDLATAAVTLNPEQDMTNFIRGWMANLIKTFGQWERQQKMIDQLKQPL